MSYCRFGVEKSDVYVFGDAEIGGITCCACSLLDREEETNVPGPEEMIEHMNKHVEAGDHVPKFVFDRLQRELRTGVFQG